MEIQPVANLHQHGVRKQHVQTAKTRESDGQYSMAVQHQRLHLQRRLHTHCTHRCHIRSRSLFSSTIGRKKRKSKGDHHSHNSWHRDGQDMNDCPQWCEISYGKNFPACTLSIIIKQLATWLTVPTRSSSTRWRKRDKILSILMSTIDEPES